AAARSAVAWVSWKPAGPVQALAPPELRTTAETRPARSTCSDQTTGAALTRLAVKTPAAARRGPELTTNARSGRPFALRPAAMPAAVKPCAAVTLTVSLLRCEGRAGCPRTRSSVPACPSRGEADRGKAQVLGEA